MSIGMQGVNVSCTRTQVDDNCSNGLDNSWSLWNSESSEQSTMKTPQWNRYKWDSSIEFDSLSDFNHSFNSTETSPLSNNRQNSTENWKNEEISERNFPFPQFHRKLERSNSTDRKSFNTFSLLDQDSITTSLPTELSEEEGRFQSQHRGLSRTASDPVALRNASLSSVTLPESLQGSSDTISSAENGSVGRYKTELCRTFQENGKCKYGDKCQFAHGRVELRSLNRHPKYKTDRCKTYHSTGFCPYGPRCHFIHDDDERQTLKADNQLIQEKLLDVIQRQQIERKKQQLQQLQQLQEQQLQLPQKLLLAKLLPSQNSQTVTKSVSRDFPTFGESMLSSSSPSCRSNSLNSCPSLSAYDGNDLNGVLLSALLAAGNNYSSCNNQTDLLSHQQIIPNSRVSINHKLQNFHSANIQNVFNNTDVNLLARNTAELSGTSSNLYSPSISTIPGSGLLDASPASPTMDDVLLVAEILKALRLNRAYHQQSLKPASKMSVCDLNPFANSPYIYSEGSTQF